MCHNRHAYQMENYRWVTHEYRFNNINIFVHYGELENMRNVSKPYSVGSQIVSRNFVYFVMKLF